MNTQICNRCVMDSTDRSIVFDEIGNCNYCTDIVRRMDSEYFPNAEGAKRLDAMMEKIKSEGKGRPYDCMVGVSGGLDSSYVLYLGKRFDLRMLCVHIDDGLDTDTAVSNIEKLRDASGAEMIMVRPDLGQYKDITRSLLLAGVPNLALAQDNILIAALHDTAKQYGLKYSLSGANFAMESILQRGTDNVNSGDKRHIAAIHKRFGTISISNIRFSTMFENYITRRYFRETTTLRPLDLIDYNMSKALDDLKEFCDYEYYGGKHYESILTRFLQCYYLPVYFNFDKRKSHFSSLIMSGQMTRAEALAKLAQPAYISSELLESDIAFLAGYLGMAIEDFRKVLEQPKHNHSDYPTSPMNKLAPVARKFRRWLG